MGQSQSDGNVRSSRGRNAATSANRLPSDPSTDERRSSARRSSRMQAKLLRRMTDNSLSLNRRSRAVRKSISSFGKPKASSAQVHEGNQLVQADVPEVSSHRSAWRKSIGFVKSRRWHKAPDHSISSDNDATQDIDSSAGLPISEALTSFSNSHSPISLPPSGLDSAASSSSSPPLGNITSNPDTAILNSPDPSTSAPPLLAPAVSSEVDTSNTSATHSELNISSSHAAVAPSVDNETEPTDPVVIVTAEEPIPITPANNDANTDAVFQHVADSLEPNSTSTASETTPISPRQQFPPSGTLVVVQGVVHTTDIQLPSEPLQSPPPQTQTPNPPSNTEAPHSSDSLRTVRRASSSISSGPRGRLSALLRRSHGSSSRPGSSSSALDSNGIGSMNEATVDVRQPEGPEALDIRSASPPALSQPRNQRGNSSGSISSSSIDVLVSPLQQPLPPSSPDRQILLPLQIPLPLLPQLPKLRRVSLVRVQHIWHQKSRLR
ncbi:hypothetical protein F5050DRAFT_1148742 [Lentinula boryana]|uniref:Uncharacterized protein n=1 Tax=Lentinula boryana TaxID=40481 RepID=A0ABQ8QJU4_9AGAR|nr:hypothetical protein F5050DRAFT_1148742 [Lentinula boryana]